MKIFLETENHRNRRKFSVAYFITTLRYYDHVVAAAYMKTGMSCGGGFACAEIENRFVVEIRRRRIEIFTSYYIVLYETCPMCRQCPPNSLKRFKSGLSVYMYLGDGEWTRIRILLLTMIDVYFFISCLSSTLGAVVKCSHNIPTPAAYFRDAD